ncbi:MAG: hypothetical protein AAB420_03255 [Patescibacteria group bacterium]
MPDLLTVLTAVRWIFELNDQRYRVDYRQGQFRHTWKVRRVIPKPSQLVKIIKAKTRDEGLKALAEFTCSLGEEGES